MDGTGRAPKLSRRGVLQVSLATIGGGWFALQSPALKALAQSAALAHGAGDAFLHLTDTEAAGLEAIAARIIPADDTPGAREIGVIHFIDQALGSFLAPSAPDLRAGLAELDALAAERQPGHRFAELDEPLQDELIAMIEHSDFFELMHYLTVAGMFALPSYGGNRDRLGWQLLGFEQRHAWAPPFGHYDAEVMGVVPVSADTAVDHGEAHGHD